MTRAKRKALRILVAEDNEFNAELMLEHLTARGHEAVVIGRGDDVPGCVERQAFDLLLLDLHLPGLGGFEVIAQIRARERVSGGHLPVVALTARSRATDRERYLASGMDDLLWKPVKSADLWSVIDRLLEGTPSSAQPPAPFASPAWLDPSVLLSVCGGDPLALAKISRALQRQLPAELARAATVLEEANALALRESAHRLCGMIAVVSTTGSEEASALEDLAARGALEEAAASFARVKALTEELLAGLDALSVEQLQWLAKDRTENEVPGDG